MKIIDTLNAWLAVNQKWLLEEGATLLDLDPAWERLDLTVERAMGVMLALGSAERIPIAGLRFRFPGHPSKQRAPLPTIGHDIVHDGPGEAVDAAIHRLALYRVWRKIGIEKPKPEYIRVPDILLTFLKIQGVEPDESYGPLSSILDNCSIGDVCWTKNGEGDQALIVKAQARRANRPSWPGFYYSHLNRTIEAFNLRLSSEDRPRLEIMGLPGKHGRRYGKLFLDSEIPETIVNSTIGRPLSDLVSYPLTDAYKLRVVEIHVRDGTAMIGFDGADQMQAKTTLFTDKIAADLFAAEYTKLAPARERLLEKLSVDALSDQWWRRFKGAVGGKDASCFTVCPRSRFKSLWAPKDPFNTLLA